MYKIIISTLLFISSSFAETSYTFIGGQTSFLKYNDNSAPSIGLKYGIQRGMWRTSINLEHSKSSNNKLNALIFQVDRGIFKQATKNSNFKPHVGFSVGMLQHKSETTNKGSAIGLNTGATYLLNNNIDLDLSYRYLAISQIDDLNSVHNLTLSLHYFY